MSNLTETKIKASKAQDKPYKLFDGKGLFLLVTPAKGRLWRFKYRFEGKEKLLSFGVYPAIGLKTARDRCDDARKQVANGIDPSAKRKAERVSRADTFAAIANEYLALKGPSLSQSTLEKSRWLLEDLLYPHIGSRPIKLITAPDILAALRKIESRGKHESTHRAKWKAGQVFRYAIATGRADRDPTADLRGALAPVTTRNRSAVTSPALIGALLRAIDGYSGQPATEAALKLAALVFVRPGELRNARWEEFDLDDKEPCWRIPGERMKMGEEHLVPLCEQAVRILRDLYALTGPNGLLFPGLRSTNRPISDNTINGALRRLGYSKDEMTAHGFRAMASTALNELGYPPDVIELQLAHAERNKVRAAYNRAQRLKERHKLMQAWGDYLDSLKASSVVVPIRRKA
jgi:integrase